MCVVGLMVIFGSEANPFTPELAICTDKAGEAGDPPPPAFAITKASVATLVVLSPGDWVVAVVPFGSAGVPERLAAVPVVIWFHV